jgi:hypothetical protein
LRSFRAVEEQSLPAPTEQDGGRRTLGGRHRAGRSEEDEVEVHTAILVLGFSVTWAPLLTG